MKTAVYCGTRNIYHDMIPSLKSLLIHSSVEKVYFLIEDDNFPEYLPPIVECINVSQQTIFKRSGPNYANAWTYMVLMRAALTKVLPQSLDRVLSLDCDTIILQDIAELWDINLTNYYLAGVKEPKKSNPYYSYVNMGVVMFNLEKLRADKKDNEIIYCLNNKHYYFNEQDCINIRCAGKILPISNIYNANAYTGLPQNPKIRHYAASRIWQSKPLIQKYGAIPWEEIRKC